MKLLPKMIIKKRERGKKIDINFVINIYYIFRLNNENN